MHARDRQVCEFGRGTEGSCCLARMHALATLHRRRRRVGVGGKNGTRICPHEAYKTCDSPHDHRQSCHYSDGHEDHQPSRQPLRTPFTADHRLSCSEAFRVLSCMVPAAAGGTHAGNVGRSLAAVRAGIATQALALPHHAHSMP